jgi:hypothetical protein
MQVILASKLPVPVLTSPFRTPYLTLERPSRLTVNLPLTRGLGTMLDLPHRLGPSYLTKVPESYCGAYQRPRPKCSTGRSAMQLQLINITSYSVYNYPSGIKR